MFTINLRKKLETIPPSKTDAEKQEELLLQQAQLVLEQDGKDDMDIYQRLGWKDQIDSGIKIGDKFRNTSSTIKNLDKKRVFTITQIRSLCIEYYLRFLPSDQFKGNIDPTIPLHVKEFQKLSNLEYPRYFIVAPKSSFKLEERPRDPLLFAEIEEGKLYYLVHKWGNDINVFRKLLFFTDTRLGAIIWPIAIYAMYFGILKFFEVSCSAAYIIGGIVLTVIYGCSIGNNKFVTDNWKNKFKD